MFIKDGKPINIQVAHVFGDDQVPAGNLLDAENRAKYGISEVPDPVPLDGRYYFNNFNEDGSITSTPKTVEQVKQVKMVELASNRYNVETGGITVGGVMIRTDRESQGILAGALLMVQRNPAMTINWKGVDGWVTLNATQIGTVADAVGAHVQACFNAEKAKLDVLAALSTFDDVVAFDTTVTP